MKWWHSKKASKNIESIDTVFGLFQSMACMQHFVERGGHVFRTKSVFGGARAARIR